MSVLLYLLLAVYLAGVLFVFSVIFDEYDPYLGSLITPAMLMLGIFHAVFWPGILLIGCIKDREGGEK